MKNLNPNHIVDSSNVSQKMLDRYADLCSCHHKMGNALHAVTRMIEILNYIPKTQEEHNRKFRDAKSFWCAFAVNYYSCFNDGLGTNTKRIIKLLSFDELSLHREIESDRNKYFCHTGTHNTSRIFQTGFDENGLPEIGLQLLVLDHPSYAKNLGYKKLAERVQKLISDSLKNCADTIKKDLVVRDRSDADFQKSTIAIKSKTVKNISRVEEHGY